MPSSPTDDKSAGLGHAAVTVIHRDTQLLIVNKPPGLVVHTSATDCQSAHTLVDYIYQEVEDTDSERPGIVHRLDKDTSGVMVVARTLQAKQSLQTQFYNRAVDKQYMAVVAGDMEPRQARIDLPIGRHPKHPTRRAVRSRGKPAVTEYAVVEPGSHCSLVEAYPRSGRTHQLRVHFAYMQHPIVGDQLYGGRHTQADRLYLHSHRLGFRHPATGQTVSFAAAIPSAFHEILL